MASYNSRSIRLPSDLFALAVHPTAPLITAALCSGHVYTYTWPSTPEEKDEDEDDDVVTTPAASGDPFTIAWKTRRHKGSCRAAVYSSDGSVLYTDGIDGLIKAADSSTGRVISKSLLPSASDAPTTLLPLSPVHLLAGTDDGNIHLYDLRTPSTLTSAGPAASWKHVHEDYISSLLALPVTAASTTGFPRQFAATGDTSLSHLDVRKPGKVLARSEPQEDEILCTAFVANAPSKNTGGSEKLLTGTAAGVVTTWNKGFWEDHQERIPLSRSTGDSIDSVLALGGDFEVVGAGWGTFFAAGSGDGKVRIVKMGGNKVVATMAHSVSADEARRAANARVKRGDYDEGLEEGVSALGIDCEGRIVSGGGQVVKVWSPSEEQEAEAEGRKRRNDEEDSDEASDSDAADSEDSDDEKEKKKRKKKKRKGGKGKAKSAGVRNVNSFSGLD
ncbi:WD40-repeat-containing domain protein [Tricharina praecox]|uniref:WD40-repeat-containing domain protein n=1 Tax=Tricharina praecox TaxID=43433 RepID=UPI0022201E5B|nr:WD40-repeat-containing domain protein [Tricharina praecox]KAI5858349.1 WD40-repeat-containing domain protein [Tricharina praecox]